MTSEAYDTILFRMVCSECLLSKCSCLLLQLNASISSREDKLEIKFSWTHAVINIQCSYPRRSRLQLTISFFFFCKNIIIKKLAFQANDIFMQGCFLRTQLRSDCVFLASLFPSSLLMQVQQIRFCFVSHYINISETIIHKIEFNSPS